jgi:hypothetical protein
MAMLNNTQQRFTPAQNKHTALPFPNTLHSHFPNTLAKEQAPPIVFLWAFCLTFASNRCTSLTSSIMK